ncbi:MAG: CmcI family methyltransferase [Acidimicrobiales bacterium]
MNARRVVEIGALRGENTVLMLDRLGPDTELHVIDPVPDFDPVEHAKQFGGQYVFHQDLSVNVLGQLPPMDAALIDGDHNWYTVFNECRLLSEVARGAGQPLPVLILHDVLWPYGRRDLYYSPDNIPKEHRQTWERRGMSPHKKKLLNAGGLNMSLANAVEEGGPRNGVLTGLEDWMATYDKPLRLVVLPIYFGLAFVVEEERLAQNPELAAVLDRLESREGRFDLLELSESIRIEAAIFTQSVMRVREEQLERASRRYLDLLKGALIDEHYLENELRIQHLITALEHGGQPSRAELRDPHRLMRRNGDALRAARRAGGSTGGDLVSHFPYTTLGRVGLDALEAKLDLLQEDKVGGDLFECGTGRGGSAIFMRGYLDSREVIGRKVWVADRFRASPLVDADGQPEEAADFSDLLADLNIVRDAFHRFDLLDDRVRFLQGDYAETLPDAPVEKIALLRLGAGLGAEVADILDLLYARVAVGGIVLIEEAHEPATAQAIADFRTALGVDEQLEQIGTFGTSWRKVAKRAVPALEPVDGDGPGAVLARMREARAQRLAQAGTRRAAGSPLAPPVPSGNGATSGAKHLSVVVVFYNMKREAARTLKSLSRSYQHDIDDLDYEVIVVENGSSEDEKLGAEWVQSFGPEFRYLDLGDRANPSPVFALNEGVARSVGSTVALMIDGAHVLTPGVLHYGMLGIRQYEPAIVTTQQWYVGPGQQPEAMAAGYDQDFEDQLFERIEWPANGYRLFDIGHFIGGRDWFDGIWESNCVFVPRSVLEQVGAFDESFAIAGGGYANLELYERLGSTAGVHEATILGEGSFHQVHGGTTTNVSDVDDRRERIAVYAGQYADMRGKGFRGPNKQMHYVGTMFPEAVRTRSRRKTAPEFFRKLDPADPDGRPQSPEPIPEDLEVGYTEAYWRHLGWKKTSWLGRRVAHSPGDMISYQEIIHEVRPDWIIDLRSGDGGRAMFLASICSLVEHGRVLSIDDREQPDLPEHPRITWLHAPTHGEETAARVAEIVGDPPRAMVVLGTASGKRRIVNEFETYAPFVPVGSYVIVEETIVGGHPVWPSFGPGPWEAVREILDTNPSFVADPSRESYGLSFNPSGYLKRRS